MVFKLYQAVTVLHKDGFVYISNWFGTARDKEHAEMQAFTYMMPQLRDGYAIDKQSISLIVVDSDNEKWSANEI